MFKFTKTGIFCFFIIIMFCLTQIFINRCTINSEINEEMMEENITEEIKNVDTTGSWQIEIPQILLIAQISEGTTKEILNQYVGHFENTSKQEGNVGLAAYNKGYDVNYFKDLKLLRQGDEIKYTHNEFERTYEVKKCRIIKDSEWEYLEQTEENMLTLITYIENQPEYRRCIQAVEKEEETY